MIVEICVCIATLIFFVLAAFVIQTIKVLQKSLNNLNKLTKIIEPKIEESGLETLRVLHSSNHLITTLHNQLNSFNPLLKCISDVGCVIHKVTNSFSEEKIKPLIEEDRKPLQKERLEALVELIALGILFWQQIKKKGDRHAFTKNDGKTNMFSESGG